MLLPSIFNNDFFDTWMDDMRPFRWLNDETEKKLYGSRASHMMATDVHEHEDHYDVDVDLPGFTKDEIELQLNDGYLSITASKGLDEEKQNNEGRVVRRERYAGTMSRSFYVGEQITEDEIKARFENGVLKLTVPKKEAKKVIPEKKTIMIEG
ncbi:MAG: Hsp20/alpha crystallin family protein [Eubacteriaceae bacterium]|nr:Hsp20/alpha crystallin family protein [Eubacteriaceae bacterium]